MKKILITSKDVTTGFAGAVEIIYGMMRDDNTRALVNIDLRGAALNDKQRCWLLERVPVFYGAGYEKAWGINKLAISEADMELDFEEDFWKPYDKKVNKDRCIKEWNKLSKADKSACVHGLLAYLRHLSQNTWRPKKDPEGYFRNKMWSTDWDNVKS